MITVILSFAAGAVVGSFFGYPYAAAVVRMYDDAKAFVAKIRGK